MGLMAEALTRMRALSWRTILRDYGFLTAGGLLMALSFDVFLSPAEVAPGGVPGVAIIINRFTGLPEGLTMLVLNLPLLVPGFFYLGRFRFLARTFYAVIIFNVGVDVLPAVLPPEGITDDILLNTLYGAVIGGIGSGLIYRGRGTPGGTGVISRILQRRTGIPISQLHIAIDGAVILALGLFLGWEKSLYALVMLFLWGLVTDYVLEGPGLVRTAFIVTETPNEVATHLFERMGVGVTAWEARGMFTERERTVLFCTISRPDVNTIKWIVAEADPSAFVVIGEGHQVRGGYLGRAPEDD
ncbi:MAG: YitT family protein [Candidatus Bipolaricaulia bacterium]